MVATGRELLDLSVGYGGGVFAGVTGTWWFSTGMADERVFAFAGAFVAIVGLVWIALEERRDPDLEVGA